MKTLTTGVLKQQSSFEKISIAIGVLQGSAVLFAALAIRFQSSELRLARKHMEWQLQSKYEDELHHLNPELYRWLGLPDATLDAPSRQTAARLFTLVAQIYTAFSRGLITDSRWHGLRSELLFWCSRPEAIAIWKVFRARPDELPKGFVPFLDNELIAYARETGHVTPSTPTHPVEGSP